ncbi:MAG: DNA mismatch repair endonuclease MutL [Bacillota bacterium]
MPSIIVLDDVTANKIAAGEVVERPSSVVKELVENSIDAGATRINIEIRGGGLEEIRVVDNGSGMDWEDSVTAFQRHATSKIKDADDINSICSLGFRGEALPSIASVSKVTLITRPPDKESGARLEIEGGRLVSREPVGCPPGTSIAVSQLFFNTPARLKYMKSRAVEAGHISDTVSKLALSRPYIGIRLLSEGRTIFSSPGSGSLQDSFASVYGPDISRVMLPFGGSGENMSLDGLIGPPSVSRSNKNHITVIINGRFVKNSLVNTAVIDGYDSRLPQGRYPLAVVNIVISPELMDVNVHPSKMTVKIASESTLFNLVRRAVTEALRTDRLIPGFTPDTVITHENKIPEPNIPEQMPAVEHTSYTPPRPVVTSMEQESQYTGDVIREPNLSGEAKTEYLITSSGRNSETGSENLLDNIYPIGFLPPTYILAGNSGGLVIIDHHAAHERIMYEKFIKSLSAGIIEAQILLMPVVIQLSPREYRYAEENLAYLSGLGIDAQLFGNNSLVIREFPSCLPHSAVEDIVRDIIDYIIEQGRQLQKEDLVKKAAASSACKAAVKSGTKSSLEEADAIIEGLKRTENPYTCPHGRPTMIFLGDSELKTRFKRT